MHQVDLAFRQELVALLPRLRRFAFALAGGRDSGEDLLQSAVERALRKSDSFERGRRLDSWMFKLMQNLWFDMRRSSGMRGQSLDDMADIAGDDPRDTLEARDELRAVREAFTKLNEDQRSVVALVVLEGFSYVEAAAALDVPIGTVMSRLSRARSALASSVRGGATLSQVGRESEL